MAAPQSNPTVELERQALNGWLALLLVMLWFVAAIALLISTVEAAEAGAISDGAAFRILGAVLMVGLGIFLCFGFFTLEPNEARVLILFGAYKGTMRRSGFHWANPLYARHRGPAPTSGPASAKKLLGEGATQGKSKTKLSLRAHNFNSPTLKVNDKRGNPVEIAAVVVWRVEDTAQAAFDVEDYESYVKMQSESAIRSIASLYAYDHGEEHEITLRGGGDEVAHALTKTAGTLGEGRRRRRGVAAHAPRLCARDRARDAASPAGRSRHRRAREDRARRRQHGRDGARRARQKERRQARQGA